MSTSQIIALIASVYFLWIILGLIKVKQMDDEKLKSKKRRYWNDDRFIRYIMIKGPFI